MATGTVKWFNSAKGFGFITPDDGGNDIFVHISAVERSGLNTLTEGVEVNFEVEEARDGRPQVGRVWLSGTHGSGGGPRD